MPHGRGVSRKSPDERGRTACIGHGVPTKGAGRVALTIGVDIGGTKVLGGVVDSAGDVLAQTRRDTPADDPSETAVRIAEVIKELAAAHPVSAVGIGAAGWIDA